MKAKEEAVDYKLPTPEEEKRARSFRKRKKLSPTEIKEAFKETEDKSPIIR